MLDEIRQVEGFPGYKIDKEGNVYSAWKRGGVTFLGDKWRVLKPTTKNRYGHLRITLSRDGKPHCFAVQRIVAQAFLPNPTNLPCVCHNDGDPANNNISNLRWDTYQGNADDTKKHCTRRYGVNTPSAKLNSEKVKLMKLLFNDFGWRKSALAKLFNVHWDTVYLVLKGKYWNYSP